MTQAATYDNVPVFTGEIATQENSGFFQPVKPEGSTALAASDQARAIAEVQAALVIAQANPRNELRARDRLMQACSRVGLAQGAVYDYPRGNEQVSGATIRLAEAAARSWGNMTYGFREVDRRVGESDCEAFAWDLETNCKAVRQFTVRHRRDTKKGGYDLKDERDIYEMIANYAQRRVRAAILEIIPGDIIEDAVAECQRTLAANVGEIKAARAKILSLFEPLGVKKDHLEQRLGNRLDAAQPGQVMKLWRIYNSIADGSTAASDWFDMAGAAPKQEGKPTAEAGTPTTQPGTAATKVPAKGTEVPAQPAQPAQAKTPAAKPPAKPARQAEPGDDFFPGGMTVPCPDKDNRPVDEINCAACARREGCPSWQE